MWLTLMAMAAASTPSIYPGPAGPVIRPRPNFVVILVDDLDKNLGGLDASTLVCTRHHIGKQGITMSNWLAQSPVCCDSRAELLTGKMFHNLRLGDTFGSMSNYLDPIPLVKHKGWITAVLVLLIGVTILLVVPLLAFFSVNNPYLYILEEKLKVLCGWNRSTTLSEPLLSNRLQELNDENDATRGVRLRHNQKLTMLIIGSLSVLIIIAISFIVVLQPGKAGQGCMNIDVADNIAHPFYQRDFFAGYFKDMNYTVGYFGKLLNSELPTTFRPMGVDEMLINDGGTYLNPKFTIGNDQSHVREVVFDNCSVTTGMPCYSTSIIGNASLAWIQRHIASGVADDDNEKKKPFFAFIALKAPHIEDNESVTFEKAIPAPWYINTTIHESKAIRTPNYNCSTDNHHWLIRNQLPMTSREAEEADTLLVSRLRALMSVDDLVDDLFHVLKNNHILDETCIIFTSDNGFHLGQFRLPGGKWQAYEDDIRLPMMIRGPGIQPNTTSTMLATHVDLMPTLLGLAGQTNIPATMDGRNLASCLLVSEEDDEGCKSSATSSVLVEYLSLGNVTRYNHTMDYYNHSFLALRTIIQQPQSNDDSSITIDHWSYMLDSAGPNMTLRDIKYIEYRDLRVDWTAVQPMLEQELFDLDRDPYELQNLIPHVSPVLLQMLQHKLKQLQRCKGNSCRQEISTSINNKGTGIISAEYKDDIKEE